MLPMALSTDAVTVHRCLLSSSGRSADSGRCRRRLTTLICSFEMA